MNAEVSQRRGFEKLVGSMVALSGLSLLGLAILIAYADLIRESPSVLVVNLAIAVCGGVGIFCALAGARLISGKRTRFDGLLLAESAWALLSVFFLALGILAFLSRRVPLAVAGLWLALVCYGFRRTL